MKLGLPTFLRTTTFKLAMIYTAMFGTFSAALMAYLYFSTAYYIQTQSERQLTSELQQLANGYLIGGFDRLSQSVFERMNANGEQYFYYLENPEGKKDAGFLDSVPFEPAGPEKTVRFELNVELSDGSVFTSPAAGRAMYLRDGGKLMVGYVTRQQGEIVRRIQNAILIAAPIGLILSLVGGMLISRGAARRADELAKTAEAVMGGELGRRAPVRGSGDEFDRLGLRINGMLDQIEKLMEATRNTGNAIAHDLRSPLSRLRNKLEVAIGEPLSKDEANARLEETVEEVDRVLATFNAILRLARLDAGAEGKRVRMDVSEIAKELAELFEPACEEAELSFKSKIDHGLTLLGDRDLIGQALVNLLDNAVKYTPAGGAISFKVARGPGNSIDLIVLDTGPGIPESSRALAVERFHRMDSARTLPGSGLGLSLVVSVAEMHGGELLLSSGAGKADAPGLKAVLRLPRT